MDSSVAPSRAEQRMVRRDQHTSVLSKDRSSNRTFSFYEKLHHSLKTYPAGSACLTSSYLSCCLWGLAPVVCFVLWKAGAWLNPEPFGRRVTGRPECPLATVGSISSSSLSSSAGKERGQKDLGYFHFFSCPGGHCPFHAKQVVGVAGTELFCKAFD